MICHFMSSSLPDFRRFFQHQLFFAQSQAAGLEPFLVFDQIEFWLNKVIDADSTRCLHVNVVVVIFPVSFVTKFAKNYFLKITFFLFFILKAVQFLSI